MGAAFWAAAAWTLFEFGRPPTPPMLPLLLTAAVGGWWLAQKAKVLSTRDLWWGVLILASALGIVFATNNFDAFKYTRLFVILIFGICLPFQTLFASRERVRAWVLTFVGITAYVGAWAATHAGFGPAGSDGQDENYVATLMAMGIAFAYFAFFAERSKIIRLFLVASMGIHMAAVALAANPSRGGFLGILAVAAYCLYRSPRRALGLSVIAAAGLALLAVAGDTFWNEISTTTDYESGTGDMRLELWKAGFRMWMAHPVAGVGAGNFLWRVGDFQSAEQFEKFGRSLGGAAIAHSTPVELVAELGTLGLLAFVGLGWMTWRGLGRLTIAPKMLRRPDLPHGELQVSCYADGLRAAIIAVMVTGVFLSLLYYSHYWVLVAVGTGLVAAESPSRRPGALRGRTRDRAMARPTPMPASATIPEQGPR